MAMENTNFSLESNNPTAEIINYFKMKFNSKVKEYEEIIEKKNEVINSLNLQINSLQSLIEELKQRYSQTEMDVLEQNKELFMKMEESKQILLKQKEKHQREINLFKDMFERTKIDLKNLSKELDELKKERNRLKEETIKLSSEKSALEDKLKSIDLSLRNSKEAVEQTVSELLIERKKLEEASKKIFNLEKEKEDLKKQIESLRVAWDNERDQWKEMWERERSLWESHRMEFAVWEERLRTEREQWLSKLKEEEEKGVKGARDLAKVLEDASKWSYKVGELLKLYATDSLKLPQVFVTQKTIEKKVKSTNNKILFIFFSAVFALSTIFYFAYDYKTKLHFSKITTNILDSENYTGFVKSGDVFIFSTWDKGIVIKDKDFKTISRVERFSGNSLKISAITQDGYNLWLLDLGGLRFLRVDPYTGDILKSYKTIGVAPQGISFDGVYLWSFDAASGLLYRYDINGDVKGVGSYQLDGIKTVDWIGWVDGKLYVVSNNVLYRFSYSGDKFKKISTQKLKNSTYCYLYNDELYILKDEGNIKKIDVLKIKNKEYV